MLTGEFFIATVISVVAAAIYVLRDYRRFKRRSEDERMADFVKTLHEL